MKLIEMARRLVELGEGKKALNAYELAINEVDKLSDLEKFEAAYYVLNNGGDYKLSYKIFIELYNLGLYQNEIFDILLYAFYEPNIEKNKKRYNLNCKLLNSYPYFFKKDFNEFESLPIVFFPYDDNGYIPFYISKNQFGEYFNPNETIITTNFFKDLSKPILADNTFSQYEIEYLFDNVRKSEWVGYENHIYLCYDNWELFLAFLQVLEFKKMLKDEKFVFLFEEERELYPINFKEKFNIDYSEFPLKPIGIREVNKLVWHVQSATHTGGDFFNEVFYNHPNLLAYESIMFDSLENISKQILYPDNKTEGYYGKQLKKVKNRTLKDGLVALFLEMCTGNLQYGLDTKARIAPALLLQPHFHNINCDIKTDEEYAIYENDSYEELRHSSYINDFKYIKTFSTIRRPTTSYGATVKFMHVQPKDDLEKPNNDEEKNVIYYEALSPILRNKSYLVDKNERFFKDSVMVRFEDGKLNPKATLLALAQFIDIPYTNSMTYCSCVLGKEVESREGNDIGFSTSPVYRTYDDYVNDEERKIVEFFKQDIYKEYGYDFMYYKGENIDEEYINSLTNDFSKLSPVKVKQEIEEELENNSKTDDNDNSIKLSSLDLITISRKEIMRSLLVDFKFISKKGQPLQFIKKLELDETLLETELYR